VRVHQLSFGILYHVDLLKQTALAANDIQIGIDKVKPQVENKVVLRSNLLQLQAQLLQVQQRAIEIKASRKGFVDALAQFLNQPLAETVRLEVPADLPVADSVIRRPEVTLFQNQSLLLAGQQKLINARNLPKASAFVQGGYGRPGLNMLSNEFKLFYIGGLRLTWSLGGFYNAQRDKQLIVNNRQSVDLQQQTFLLNTRAQLEQQRAEMDKYAALQAADEEIIQLRRQITDAAKAQLENAVITANDYLQQVNAEDATRQALILHRLQFLQAQTNYLITSGKL
jgi:outer membrane protein TolC